MGLILEPEHQILVENSEYLAVRQLGNIELWDPQGEERYGILPENYTLADIERLMSFYRTGFINGKRYGQTSQFNEIRNMLNL